MWNKGGAEPLVDLNAFYPGEARGVADPFLAAISIPRPWAWPWLTARGALK